MHSDVLDLEIADGWFVSDLETVEDCEDAYVYLMTAVARIEYDLEVDVFEPREDPTWRARARRALKFKRAALQVAQNLKGRLSAKEKKSAQESDDRALLQFIKASVDSKQFSAWCEAYRAAVARLEVA